MSHTGDMQNMLYDIYCHCLCLEQHPSPLLLFYFSTL